MLIWDPASLSDRLSCALVCKAWAKAVTTAGRSIAIKQRLQESDFTGLKKWLEKHGDKIQVLQLHECYGALTALPCAQLQNLLLCGQDEDDDGRFGTMRLKVDPSVWRDVGAATQLTSVSLSVLDTACQQADVVSALTALPNLEQLTWQNVQCSGKLYLTDSRLLQQLTKLTALKLHDVFREEALQHLGSLRKLQNLSISGAACPGLQELKELTRLQLDEPPANASQLTTLQQLEFAAYRPTALIGLPTSLKVLRVLVRDSLESARLQDLQRLELYSTAFDAEGLVVPMSILAGCTRLRVLSAHKITLKGPGSLVVSTMLEPLELDRCIIEAADGIADPVSWQQVFPGPGQLPHLTALQLSHLQPVLKFADVKSVVARCSSLQVLHLGEAAAAVSFASVLVRLPALTSLHLDGAVNNGACRSVARLTGLKALQLSHHWVSGAGLRALTALVRLSSLRFDDFDPDLVSWCIQGQFSDPRMTWPPPGYIPNCLVNEAPAACVPDVSPRLKLACNMAAAQQRRRYLLPVLEAVAMLSFAALLVWLTIITVETIVWFLPNPANPANG